MRLIQPVHDSEDPARQSELIRCLEANRDGGLFTSIVNPTGRPTFSELFALCSPDDINVIANSDIRFDASIRLANACTGDAVCLALSRWDVQLDGRSVRDQSSWSQDVWIVHGRPRVRADFPQGTPACDNAIAYILQRAGLDVINPSKSIRCHHEHLSNVRSYLSATSRVAPAPGPHVHLPPTGIWAVRWPRLHGAMRIQASIFEEAKDVAIWLAQSAGLAALRAWRKATGRSLGALGASIPSVWIKPGYRRLTVFDKVEAIWSTSNGQRIEIRVGAPGGLLFVAADQPGRKHTGTWVQHGTRLFLQDADAGRPQSGLATIDILRICLPSGRHAPQQE